MLLNTLILIQYKNVQFVKRIQLLKLQHKWEILIGFFMMQIFVPFRSVSTFIRIYLLLMMTLREFHMFMICTLHSDTSNLCTHEMVWSNAYNCNHPFRVNHVSLVRFNIFIFWQYTSILLWIFCSKFEDYIPFYSSSYWKKEFW